VVLLLPDSWCYLASIDRTCLYGGREKANNVFFQAYQLRLLILNPTLEQQRAAVSTIVFDSESNGLCLRLGFASNEADSKSKRSGFWLAIQNVKKDIVFRVTLSGHWRCWLSTERRTRRAFKFVKGAESTRYTVSFFGTGHLQPPPGRRLEGHSSKKRAGRRRTRVHVMTELRCCFLRPVTVNSKVDARLESSVYDDVVPLTSICDRRRLKSMMTSMQFSSQRRRACVCSRSLFVCKLNTDWLCFLVALLWWHYFMLCPH